MARIKTFANVTARSSVFGGLLDTDDLWVFLGAFLGFIILVIAEAMYAAIALAVLALAWFIFRAAVPRHYPWALLGYWRRNLKGKTFGYAWYRRKI